MAGAGCSSEGGSEGCSSEGCSEGCSSEGCSEGCSSEGCSYVAGTFLLTHCRVREAKQMCHQDRPYDTPSHKKPPLIRRFHAIRGAGLFHGFNGVQCSLQATERAFRFPRAYRQSPYAASAPSLRMRARMRAASASKPGTCVRSWPHMSVFVITACMSASALSFL